MSMNKHKMCKQWMKEVIELNTALATEEPANDDCKENIEYATYILELLDKAEPKKPIKHYIHIGDEEMIDSYNCRTCGAEVGVNYVNGHKKREHHCSCGQLIDWSKEND